jgi:hypothetical protein
VPKRGFETTFAVPAGMRYATVVAVDRHGKELGRCRTIRV